MKKWYKLLNRTDFGSVVTETGYQITYRGFRLGGGGIDPQPGASEETRMLQKKSFEDRAAYTIDQILAGSGDSRYYKAIREILDV